MKRLIALFIAMAMLSAVAISEEHTDLPDLSVYDRADLVEIASRINTILFPFALEEGILIPAGEYIVDVDIPAGTYRADTVSDIGGVCSVYDPYGEVISDIFLGNMYGTNTFRLVLENQCRVVIKYNSLKLYPYKGILDFSN